ncbi:hypothetical protein H4R19_005805 [Coemansia spiralis]|nr:hypothetical protein H4R19_005805 [Coemansia spiralis]
MAAIAEAAAEDADPTPRKVYFDNPRFALAQPRRVATFNACVGAQRAGTAIRISAILGAGGRQSTVRARPIIGLGVTLNPSDSLVRLQPRRSATQPTTDADRVARGLADAEWAQASRVTHVAGKAAVILRSPLPSTSPPASRISMVLSDAFAGDAQMLRSSISLPGLARSPRNTDPQLVPVHVALPARAASPTSRIAAPDNPLLTTTHDADEARVPEATRQPSPGPAARRAPPRLICCLLCFEQVRVGPRCRGRTRCPGCGTDMTTAARKSRAVQLPR